MMEPEYDYETEAQTVEPEVQAANALAAIRALCDAEDARVAEVNARLEREGRTHLLNGQPLRILPILAGEQVRAALDAAPPAPDDREALAAGIEQLRPAHYTQAMWRNGYRKGVTDAAELVRGGGQ